MKKFKLILLLFISTIIFNFNACSSGISQEEYDQKVQEVAQLQEEYDQKVQETNQIQEEYTQKVQEVAQLQEEISSFKSSNEELTKENEELKSGYQEKNVILESWAKTSFENPIVCFNEENKYFHCISQKKYPVNEEGIKNLVSDFLDAITVLHSLNSVTEIDFDKIDVVFISDTNKEIVQYNIIKTIKDNKPTLTSTSVLLDAADCVPLVKYLNNALNYN